MGYVGIYIRPQRVWTFLAVLARDRVSILAILVSNRAWFLDSSLEFGMLLRRSYFSSLSITPSTEALHSVSV